MDEKLKKMLEQDFENGNISGFEESIYIHSKDGLVALAIFPYERRAEFYTDPRIFKEFKKYIIYCQEMDYKTNLDKYGL